MAEKLPIWFQTRTVLSPQEVLVGLAPLNKAPTTSISGVFIKFSECQAALHTRKARYWWVSGDGSGLAVCRPKFLTTKNRRLNNSDLCLSLHITRLCQTFFQRENFAQIFRDFAQIFRILPGFPTNQIIWGCTCTSCTPPPTQVPTCFGCPGPSPRLPLLCKPLGTVGYFQKAWITYGKVRLC